MAPGAVGVTKANPAIGEVHSLLSFSSLTLTGLDVGTPFFCLEATFTAAITHSNSTSPLPPSLLRHSLQIYFTTPSKSTSPLSSNPQATSVYYTLQHHQTLQSPTLLGPTAFLLPCHHVLGQPAVCKT